MKGKIAFIPFADIDTCSTRIFCYQTAEQLRKLGWNCKIGEKNAEDADFVVFQKRYSTSDQALAKRCKGKVISHICDPNWLIGQGENIETMAKIADYIIVPSNRLADWFRKRNQKIGIIPAGFDFKLIPKGKKYPKITLCWTGTRLNEKYLRVLIEPLNQLAKEFEFGLNIITHHRSKIPSFNFQPTIIEWKLNTCLEEITKCHIGLSPLFNNEVCSYKGFNKNITYMALGLPIACTSVPSYEEIINNGRNGFIIKDNNPKQWYQALRTLITDKKVRLSFIEQGRKTAQNFSIENIAKKWEQLLKRL